jgi:solute carrier family 13 (sodium-dependent dicarboxylate transporter), member 2/3/5
MAAGWILREPKVFGTFTLPGITTVAPGIDDSTIAIAGALILFIARAEPGRAVLEWHDTKALPWGVLLLFGGGLALAEAVTATGLAEWIAAALPVSAGTPAVALVLLVAVVVILLTELTSNTATAAAFLPLVAAIAIGIGENPLMLAVPAALAASCAFMMPVATPPNAIVYGSGYVTIAQMIRAGAWLNALFAVAITVLMYAVVGAVLDVTPGVVPDWVAR